MRIHVSARGVSVSADLMNRIERRVRFALGRFSSRIARVRVRLIDINGPKGGIDTRCTIQVEIPGQTSLYIHETQVDAEVAVDLATDRAGRAVARRTERARSGRRRRPELAA